MLRKTREQINQDNEDSFLGMGKGAKGRRQQKRSMRMRRRESRTKILEAKAGERELDNQGKQVQVGVSAALAQEATAPGAASGVTPGTTAPATPLLQNKNVMIGGGVVVILLVLAVVFFFVKK